MLTKPDRPITIMDIRHFREVTIASKIITKYMKPGTRPRLEVTIPRFAEASNSVAKYTAIRQT